MQYKKYFRKTSLKKKEDAIFFLKEIESKKPKFFLEIGVFHGVTARNVCELLYQIHHDDFKYIGLDLFAENNENKSEVIPNTNFNTPLKEIYFKYIKKQDPYSMEAVQDLLKKFKNNVHLIKGNSKKILKDFSSRIIHVRCKDIRKSVLENSLETDLSFRGAFLEGAFTVPGDGCIDYKPLFDTLKAKDYSGWLVVEAEQDPAKANPFEYAKIGYKYLTETLNKSNNKIFKN